MISYRPFWDTLAARGMTTYDLIYKQGISANTIQRMRQGKPITTTTLNEFCDILDCTVEEVIQFRVAGEEPSRAPKAANKKADQA